MAIFGKPMIQVHGKTFLSMKFKSIIKTHDSNPWQFIHPKPNSHWQYQNSILIDNIKVQLPLATSNPNFHWHYFIKKKRVQDYQTLGKGKNISCYRSKKRTMTIILWRNSLRAILRIMFSYYKPMKYMNIICNIEFIKVNIIYKRILKLVLLFQTIQLIAQKPIASIYEKSKNIY